VDETENSAVQSAIKLLKANGYTVKKS